MGKACLVAGVLLLARLSSAETTAPTTIVGDTTGTIEEPTDETERAARPRIIIEAELPAGFPMPGPPSEVIRKAYPAYRAASATGSGAFWKLFGHIQREGIAMTTPVEMTPAREPEPATDTDTNTASGTLDDADATDDPGLPVSRDAMRMAFLYADPELGDVGPDGVDAAVEIEDHAAVEVLSFGFFGNPNPERLNEAQDRIMAALSDEPALVADGDWRLLGYNSPGVPAARRYHEVQRPVRAIEESPVGAAEEADAGDTVGENEAASPSP